MKLSIVIPVFNNWNFTRSCLGDLQLLPTDHEIIVVDNGSTDQTQQQILPIFAPIYNERLKYIRLPDNIGFAKACNHGYAKSAGDNVMFLNNDIRVSDNYKTWTEPLLAKANEAIVGPTIGILDSQLNFVREANVLPQSGGSYVYMSGWNITSSREIWQKLIIPPYQGPFTEEFGTYFEDGDLSLRATELHIPFTLVSVPVRHFGKATSKKMGVLSLYNPAKEKFITKWKDRIKNLSYG